MTQFSTFADLLATRAREQPDRRIFTFLQAGTEEERSLTYAALDSQARALGALLQASWPVGERALLLYPPGLDFIVAFFGCLYAGLVAVPVPPPDPGRPGRATSRLRAVASDARPVVALTTASLLPLASPLLEKLEKLEKDAAGPACLWIATDALEGLPPESWDTPVAPDTPALEGSHLAYLQFTSGSTAAPKGVMVTHRNLLHNSVLIQRGWGYTEDSVAVMWVPHFHDDGLVHGILQPLFTGFQSYLLPAAAMVQSPLRWLAAISRYRGTHSGGPNFAYELCARKIAPAQAAGLDLSCWSVAYNAAEPVRRETLERFATAFAPCGFRRSTFFPSFGLAEATLLVSTKSNGGEPAFLSLDSSSLERQGRVVESSDGAAASRSFVGCGRPCPTVEVAIVDPERRTRCAPDEVGEIWVAGESVADGYWNRPDITEATFRARLAEEGVTPYLRTGDLGFLRDGELFITGRSKDLIIIRGRNLYPQDVELTVERSHPALRPGCGAAFPLEVDGEERLGIIQEIDVTQAADLVEVSDAVCRAVSELHDVQVHTLALLAPRTIPKTSSGKIQRRACREALLTGALEVVHSWALGAGRPAPPPDAVRPGLEPAALRELLGWLRGYAEERIDSRSIDERRSIPPSIVLDFASRGLLGLQAAAEEGGLALSSRQTLRVLEQLGSIDLTLATFVIGHNFLGLRPIQRFAAPALRRALVPELAAGKRLAAFALTEPGAGSNPQAITAQAVPNGRGGWRLYGTKSWIGSAAWAAVISVFAQSVDERGRPLGITGFAVPQGTAGLGIGPEDLTMGLRGMSQCTLHLEGVEVGREHLLGEVGGGLAAAQDAMSYTRLCLGAVSVGAMKRCAQLMLRYASQRSIATGRLLDNPVTLVRFSELTAATAALGALVEWIAECFDLGRPIPVEIVTACCKVVGPELLWQAVDGLVQLLGGRGYIETNLVPQMLRDARVFRIFEGPTEALTMHLGAVAAGSDELDRCLRDLLEAPAVADRLREVARGVRDRLDRGELKFADRLAALRWGNSLIGEVAAQGVLLAAVRRQAALSSEGSLDRAAEWARLRFEAAAGRALGGRTEELVLLGARDVTALVAAFKEEIGDLDPVGSGGQHTLDPLLRREPREKKAVSPAPPPAAWHEARPLATAVPAGQTAVIRYWIVDWLAREIGVGAADIDPSRPFTSQGLDSVTGVRLAGELSSWLGQEIDGTAVWRYPTIDTLARHLAGEEADAPALAADIPSGDLEWELAALERLSEEEALATLLKERWRT